MMETRIKSKTKMDAMDTVDVAKVRSAALAADLILGHDRYAMRYINAYRLISSDKKSRGKS